MSSRSVRWYTEYSDVIGLIGFFVFVFGLFLIGFCLGWFSRGWFG